MHFYRRYSDAFHTLPQYVPSLENAIYVSARKKSINWRRGEKNEKQIYDLVLYVYALI